MTEQLTTRRRELAHRSTDDVDVTLFWAREEGKDTIVVRVYDRQQDASFEIPSEPYLALDVYYHPFAYGDFATVSEEGMRLAA
jgi:hypothetical protein